MPARPAGGRGDGPGVPHQMAATVAISGRGRSRPASPSANAGASLPVSSRSTKPPPRDPDLPDADRASAVDGTGARCRCCGRGCTHTCIPVQVRDLRAGADTSLIKRVYGDILEPSFDNAELEALDAVLDGLTGGGSCECWGLCAMDCGTPVACILGYPYPLSRVLLIGYIAVK